MAGEETSDSFLECNDIYTEQGIELCIDNDEITDEEEGFMAGWISA